MSFSVGILVFVLVTVLSIAFGFVIKLYIDGQVDFDFKKVTSLEFGITENEWYNYYKIPKGTLIVKALSDEDKNKYDIEEVLLSEIKKACKELNKPYFAIVNNKIEIEESTEIETVKDHTNIIGYGFNSLQAATISKPTHFLKKSNNFRMHCYIIFFENEDTLLKIRSLFGKVKAGRI